MDKIYCTERLIIRKWQNSDAADHFEYCSNPLVTKFLRFPTYEAIEDSYAWFKDMEKKYAAYEGGDRSHDIDFAIELISEHKVIGSIGLAGYQKQAGGIVEVGYILNPKYHGKGFMTEALAGIFKHIKQNNLAMRIQAKHDTENTASGRVMQRAGMVFEGIHRKSDDSNIGKRRDSAYYSILAEEIIN